MKKRLLTLFMTLAMVLSMTACGSSFDATGYVEGYLDANFKGEFDAYAKLCDEDASEVEETYNKTLDDALQTCFAGISLSDDSMSQLKNAFINLYKQAKYTVNEAEKDGDKYNVSVKVEPLYLGLTTENMTDLSEQAAKKYTDENPDDSPYDQDKLYEIYAQLMVDFINEKAANPTYGEASTVDVVVYKNDAKQYTISTSDQSSLANALFTNDEVSGTEK